MPGGDDVPEPNRAGAPAPAAVVVPDLATIALEESQPVVYDRPIGVRLLHRDPDSGAEHNLVDYPRGLTAAWHHHSAAHTIVVLTGALEVNGALVGPGSYCHFPGGEPMHHAPADGEPCLFVTMFDGALDAEPLPD